MLSNQAPHRTPNDYGILTNPKGAMFDQNILEATFSIHESLLTGCKEWMVNILK